MSISINDVVKNTPLMLCRRDLEQSKNDPKFEQPPFNYEIPIYVPTESMEKAKQKIHNHAILRPITKDAFASFYGLSCQHGLLYLPYPYLVPGGRFNEMYGWDTAFPVFAWTDMYPQIMREQADNQLYQIEHYGTVLNANRTYYLSRSQPPLIGAMVAHIYKKSVGRNWHDFDPEGIYADANAWLAYAYPLLKKQYEYWVTGDRISPETGLSRYWDESDDIAPEVAASENGHFDHAIHYFESLLKNPADPLHAPVFDQIDVHALYDSNQKALTPYYHCANRAMRASGFDPSSHWGYGGLGCMDYNPVCLNSLLYKMESDLGFIADILDINANIEDWNAKQHHRKTLMKRYLWDTQAKVFKDYNTRTKSLNHKDFATIFYPLWAGILDQDTENDDIQSIAKTGLAALETEFGIVTSTEYSGSQWDHPYGWPPLQYFAFAGLQQAGLTKDAQRIAQKYELLCKRVFETNNSLFEKYNMIEGSAEIKVENGYSDNVSEAGTFLWSAAVFTLAQNFARDDQSSL